MIEDSTTVVQDFQKDIIFPHVDSIPTVAGPSAEWAASAKKTVPHCVSTESKVLGGFAFALFCMGVVGVISFLSVQRLRGDAEWPRHTEEVIGGLRLLLSLAASTK